MQKRIIGVNVINEHSVLARISGLFAGRGYNIESLTVAPVPNSDLSRITIETSGDERVLEQIIKQLNKLIPVLNVIENEDLLKKEMVLVKVSLSENLADIQALCHAYDGGIANVNDKYIIIAITDHPKRITDFIKAIQRFNPKEIVRSGIVAIERY